MFNTSNVRSQITRAHLWLPGTLAMLLLPAAIAQETTKSGTADSGRPSAPQSAGAPKPTEKPLLWIIEGPTPSFVYGTVHVPDERVLALPRVVENALARCDALYTEVPLNAEAQKAAMPRVMLAPDKSLPDLLPRATLDRVAAYFRKKDLDFAMFSRLKPWVLAVQLGLLDYLKAMEARPPLDQMIFTRAAEANKEVGGLETADEQIDLFDSLETSEQVHLIELTLGQLEDAERKGEKLSNQVVELYLAGDENKIAAFVNRQFTETDPLDRKLKKSLVTDRNGEMSRRIAAKIREKPGRSFVFAIGAAHAGGADGIVTLLEKQGFKLRRLTPADADNLKPDAPPRKP